MVDRGVHPAGSLVRLLVDSDGRVMPADNAGADVPGADDASPTCRGRRKRSFATEFRCRDRRPRSGTTGRTTRRTACRTTRADDGGNDAAPKELTPQVEIDYAARPAWVDREDRDEGSVHQISVSSGPYLRQREARKELGRQLQKATDEYINEFLANAFGRPLARLR